MTASTATANAKANSVKLSPQMTFGIVLAASILLGYLFYSMVIQPRQQAINDLKTQIEARRMTLQSDQAKAAQVETLKTQVDALVVERDRFVEALPATANFGQVVSDLRQTVSASGATLTSLNFASTGAEASPNLPAGVRPIGMTMAVRGDFPQIFQVLRNLELQGRFTDVSSVSLQTVGQNAGQGVQVQEPGSMTSNLSLVVYTFDAAQAAGTGATPVNGAPAAGGTAPAAAPAAPAAPAAGGN